MSTKKSLFGKLSISCAIVSQVSVVVLIGSGAILTTVGEQTLVVIQMISLFLVPLASIVGLILGIIGIFSDKINIRAKIAASINGAFILLQLVVFSLLMVWSTSFGS